jgi:hypothetical protein
MKNGGGRVTTMHQSEIINRIIFTIIHSLVLIKAKAALLGDGFSNKSLIIISRRLFASVTFSFFVNEAFV